MSTRGSIWGALKGLMSPGCSGPYVRKLLRRGIQSFILSSKLTGTCQSQVLVLCREALDLCRSLSSTSIRSIC